MEQPVTELNISTKEIKALTGIDVTEHGLLFHGLIFFLMGLIFAMPIGIFIALIWGLVWGFGSLNSLTLFVVLGISYTLLGIWSVFDWKNIRKRKKKLTPLLQEIANYNSVINKIDVLDKLESIGNPIQLADRETVIQALTIMREDLLRALKTEKILHDNPDFNSSDLSIDLTPIHALQIQEESAEYGKLLNDTLQIGINVQRELKTYHGK